MSRIVRGISALLVLIGVIGAIPIALVSFVGNPLPRRFTGFGSVWAALQQATIADATIINALSILVWVAWLRLTISLVIEIGARITLRPTPRVVGLGMSQQWATSLVTSVLLMVGSFTHVGATSNAAPSIHSVASSLMPAESTMPISVPRRSLVESDGPAQHSLVSHGRLDEQPLGAAVHTVQRYESFWSIAEDNLGDGARWGELVEFNRDHEVAPGVFFDGTAQRLLPGWELLIPAVGATAQETFDPLLSARVVRVKPGDSLSSIAHDQLGSAAEWPAIWEANRGHDLDGQTFCDPNTIMTGWELIIPYVAQSALDAPVVVQLPPISSETDVIATAAIQVDATAPRTASTTPAAPPDSASAFKSISIAPDDAHAVSTTSTALATTDLAATSPSDLPQIPEPAQNVAASPGGAVPGGLGVAVLVSCGVLGAVTARRRTQLRRSRVGSRLLQPSAVAIATEAALRSLGNGERITRLDIAIRAAAAELSRSFVNTTILGAIVERSGRIELLLSQAVSHAPDPWIQTEINRWQLGHDIDLTSLSQAARRVNQPCPALAHIGSTPIRTVAEPAGDGELFLDLEALGLLAIDAHGTHGVDIVRAIAAGIMVSPLAEIAHVITCGLDDTHLGHSSAQTADSVDIALDMAAGALGSTAAATSSGTTTFALRSLQQGGEAWEPAIVLAALDAAEADSDLDPDLVSLTHTAGRGLAVVMARPVVGATWTLQQESGRWVLHPLGLELTPVGLSASDLASVLQLVDEADQPLLTPITTIGAGRRAQSYLDQSEIGPWVEPDWSLMIRLLGQVEVVNHDDAPVVFERSKALELVAWLSQHRERSTRLGARTALWEMNVRDATFANVVSDARRAMGTLVCAPEGVEWLGRTLTEQLPLHVGVTTDAVLLAQRLAHAALQSPIDAINTLVPGLSLVRDLPFAGTSYLWPDAEGITSQLTLLVTSAATVLAGHYLLLGDTNGVFWATGQGLKVLAGHEELIALRMRAHAKTGDLAGVRCEWESYERAVTADAWSDGEPSPKLVSLRRELLSPSLQRV